ncbi:ABC transporter ATP-binding protein [Chryseobacterium sp. POL2]|uniref:ABC transporter ATP-binding protein n=1 Tax=Chryseobacterium sp. POL2 TaxID=2713414 RepID=UPI0013E12036|nr:ABC transporter ATP-binding protein [Chryseobacterium sp. POL2]QIG90178.1 ABC transporter ATP-binding protein [Chryseobacterium sp. POL2]
MSKNIVLDVENVSKQYRLGEVGTGSLQHDIVRWWANIRGQEDPYLKIGETNDRTQKGASDYVWALKDINFQIEQGQAVGIIGRNGAGKSTLLKLLSRVTKPTTGSIKYKGRIASLLEVGTGFHPEMTGRENIYLNGAILGMTRKEITRKFDEIVDFAGVERYIDTPVKRYSSGMYVRLAFAVAAHLESEILIVDEVLAVGDAEFQKKCLGKMNDVSKGEGRTVLFVSHNIGAVKSLCDSGVYMKNGTLEYVGEIEDTISRYLSDTAGNYEEAIQSRKDKIGNKQVEVTDIIFYNNLGQPTSEILSGDALKIKFTIENHANIDFNNLIIACGFSDKYENKIVTWVSDEMRFEIKSNKEIILDIPKFNLRAENYFFSYQISHKTTSPKDFCDVLVNAKVLSVIESDFFNSGRKIRPGNSLLLDANFY